jgi:hypothetical protein
MGKKKKRERGERLQKKERDKEERLYKKRQREVRMDC